jgi:hypothetical protein
MMARQILDFGQKYPVSTRIRFMMLLLMNGTHIRQKGEAFYKPKIPAFSDVGISWAKMVGFG